jgi:predicted component of type VI protein secretion system
MQQTGVAPRQSLGRAASDAQRFRDDVEKALAAFSSGIYTAEEIIAALTEDHPTRIDAIRRLQYELFR